MKTSAVIIIVASLSAVGGTIGFIQRLSDDRPEVAGHMDVSIDPPLAWSKISSGESRLKRIERLTSMGPDAAPVLAKEMQQATSLSVKEEFADVLVDLGTPVAIQLFADQWLAADAPEVRQALAESLKGLHSEAGLEMVASILSLTDDRIVLDAVNDTLSRMAQADTIDFLSELYEEGVENGDGLRIRVVDSVRTFTNPGAIDALVSLIETANSPELTLAAAESLAGIGSEAALTRLAAVIRDEGESSRELYEPLLQRLANATSPASEAILETIAESDPSDDIRHAAATALSKIEDEARIDTRAIGVTAREF